VLQEDLNGSSLVVFGVQSLHYVPQNHDDEDEGRKKTNLSRCGST